MKKILIIVFICCLAFSLAACGGKTENAGELPEPPEETEELPDIPGLGDVIEKVETGKTSDPKKDGEMLKVYQDVLVKLMTEYTYPDGSPCGFESDFFTIDQNRFAICDVDGDGKDELIISFTAGTVAAMSERVYGYDVSGGELVMELLEFPGVTYYSNRTAEVMLSHSQGLAGIGYWPYSFYEYNENTDCYECTATVDMWTKEFSAVNSEGESYPEDIDAEGAGTVFCIETAGQTEIISKSTYDSWYESKVADADILNIPFVSLSEKNVSAITG